MPFISTTCALVAVFGAPPAASDAIARTLDAFHSAASRADGDAYFALMSEDAIFVGTDAGEVWTRSEFEAYAAPHFSKGRGWTYTAAPGSRRISLSPAGDAAWFYETLINKKYGVLRGSGALMKDREGTWRLTQYVLSFAVPNDAAADVAERIAAEAPTPSPTPGAPSSGGGR
jgi:ketosteroid isomerase-like protein